MSDVVAIKTNHLTKQFGRTDAVHNLDLKVKEGEIFGFLGQNGAGKSTTIDMLIDFIRPTNGDILISNNNPQKEPHLVRQDVGILPDDYSLYEHLTGREHVNFAISMHECEDDPESILSRVGLADVGDQSAGSYSKGMCQRLALGMALVGSPSVLILDEPSSGIDPNGVDEIRSIIRNEADTGTTIFFSSHILEQVEAICDRVGIIENGELIAIDTIEELRNDFGTRSTLILSVDTEPLDHELLDIDGVENVEYSDGTVKIDCTNARVKSTVITNIEAAGSSVTDIDVEKTSLTELFDKITTGDIAE